MIKAHRGDFKQDVGGTVWEDAQKFFTNIFDEADF